ncbi:MAG TPA: hypothetical protein VM577_18570 [Anaerovoracaceae bacterium]|nr:hypothetical protein [Anaerovoracaceae bacterium]
MSFVFDVNNSTITGAQAMFKLKTLLVSAGWVVKSSGDGLSAFSSSSDIISSGSGGANGLANTTAWFRIQMPLANSVRREFMIQRNNANTNWIIKYSYSANFTGGSPSATASPTATDSQTLQNGGGAFFSTDSTYRWNAAADNAAPYGFWMGCFPTGGGSPSGGAFCLFPMDSGTFPVADIDPYAIYSSNTSSFIVSDFQSNTKAWIRKGLSNETFVSVGACEVLSSNVVIFPGTSGSTGVGPNPHDGYDNVIAIPFGAYGLTTPWPLGLKGISSFVKWNGSNRTTGDTLSIASSGAKDRITYKDVNLPWNGSTPTI